MSATQASPNEAEVLCQSKYNFGSYSILVMTVFLCHPVIFKFLRGIQKLL